jgi:hypothetical protein
VLAALEVLRALFASGPPAVTVRLVDRADEADLEFALAALDRLARGELERRN